MDAIKVFRASWTDQGGDLVPDGKMEFHIRVQVSPDSPEFEALFGNMASGNPISLTIK